MTSQLRYRRAYDHTCGGRFARDQDLFAECKRNDAAFREALAQIRLTRTPRCWIVGCVSGARDARLVEYFGVPAESDFALSEAATNALVQLADFWETVAWDPRLTFKLPVSGAGSMELWCADPTSSPIATELSAIDGLDYLLRYRAQDNILAAARPAVLPPPLAGPIASDAAALCARAAAVIRKKWFHCVLPLDLWHRNYHDFKAHALAAPDKDSNPWYGQVFDGDLALAHDRVRDYADAQLPGSAAAYLIAVNVRGKIDVHLVMDGLDVLRWLDATEAERARALGLKPKPPKP